MEELHVARPWWQCGGTACGQSGGSMEEVHVARPWWQCGGTACSQSGGDKGGKCMWPE